MTDFQKEAVASQLKLVLIGQLGAGKSSTLNSLYGDYIAKVSPYSVGTTTSTSYEFNVHGASVIAWDTRGFGETTNRLVEEERLKSLLETVEEFHCLMLVVALTDARVGIEFLTTVELIHDALGDAVWDNAVIVLTKCGVDDFETALVHRTAEIRRRMAEVVPEKIVSSIPIVPIDNLSETLPNGKYWQPAMFDSILARVKESAKPVVLWEQMRGKARFPRTEEELRKAQELAAKSNEHVRAALDAATTIAPTTQPMDLRQLWNTMIRRFRNWWFSN